MKANQKQEELAIRQAQSWANELEEIAALIGGRFSRSELRERALTYLRGLMSPVERKNGWQLAEEAGDQTPYATQHLLGRAVWSADEVRDDLRDYVVKYLGDEDGVLVIDETGFLKKGTKSAGVRRLYLPREWADDKERRSGAGIPKKTEFATKIILARRMIERAEQGGVPFKWVTGDSVYGGDSKMRRWLESREISYVLAVTSQYQVFHAGARRWVSEIEGMLLEEAWKRRSAGAGTKGERISDWALLTLGEAREGRRRWILFRRSISETVESSYYVVSAPEKTTLDEIVKVAGSRWAIEESFESAKGEVGLDHYEVRSWDGWYRHITLAMFAHAYLTVLRARAETPGVSNNEKKKLRIRRKRKRSFR